MADDLVKRLLNRHYEAMGRAYHSMREAVKRRGVSQDQIAKRLGVGKSLISRRLHGEENLTLRSLTDMATAIDHHVVVSFVPDEQAGADRLTASLATADAEIANLRADLKVKEIATDEAMAQGERQRAEIEGLREALESAKSMLVSIRTATAPPHLGATENAVYEEVSEEIADIDRALSQSPADALARREAEREVIAAAQVWRLKARPRDTRSVNLVYALDALAALAEQEAKGDE